MTPARPSGPLALFLLPSEKAQQEPCWLPGLGPISSPALDSSPAGVPEGLWLASDRAHVDTYGKAISFQEHLLPLLQPS